MRNFSLTLARITAGTSFEIFPRLTPACLPEISPVFSPSIHPRKFPTVFFHGLSHNYLKYFSRNSSSNFLRDFSWNSRNFSQNSLEIPLRTQPKFVPVIQSEILTRILSGTISGPNSKILIISQFFLKKYLSKFFQRFPGEFFQGFFLESPKRPFPKFFQDFLVDFFYKDPIQDFSKG